MKHNAEPLLENLRDIFMPDPAHGPWQMAVDEVLLRSCGRPAFRRYVWAEPQVTFGFFGDWKKVAEEYPHLRCTRRWTGGGIVEHGSDFTWSVCIPAGTPLFQARGDEIYRLLHESLRRALDKTGVTTNAAPGGAGGDRCFASPVRHDLLEGIDKIAGGALRRTKQGILYQGSVRLPGELHNTLHALLLRQLASSVETAQLSTQDLEQVHLIETQRYANPQWLRDRRDISSPLK
jgi:lipoate-protein ligase A